MDQMFFKRLSFGSMEQNKELKVDFTNFLRLVYLTNNQSVKVSKGAKIRNRYNQVSHVTQDTNKKVTNSQ